MVPMTFIWWIYHFWARFWPYFNFVDFRAYFGPFSLVNRVQFSNADAGAWNSFLRLGIIFYGKLMHKDTKFCYSSFDISTFGFKAPPYCANKTTSFDTIVSSWSSKQCFSLNFDIWKQVPPIHAKNVWCCGEGYFGQKKKAEKVCKSRQNVNRDKSA